MPNIFWDNILQGLSQGMQQADERKHKRELLEDLQKRHMDSEDKLREAQIGELKRKLTQGDFQNAINHVWINFPGKRCVHFFGNRLIHRVEDI